MDDRQRPATDRIENASRPHVGRWNQLVSTTNWQKGRIICAWRRSLRVAGTQAKHGTDQAWSQLVGDVSGQHVGRLRRVYERFHEVRGQFKPLHWSHFQVALDWDDAPMWLEGAVRSGWSVAQMRAKRSETLGAISQLTSRDGGRLPPTPNEDVADVFERQPPLGTISGTRQVVRMPSEAVSDGVKDHRPATNPRRRAPAEANTTERNTPAFVTPTASYDSLPRDLSTALLALRQAILRHQSDGWRRVSTEKVLAALDSLRQLTTSPPSAVPPF